MTVLERTNVRDLQPEALPYAPDLVTADLSFISLRLVLPALVRCSAPGAEFVLLVKPQFEAGRSEADGGGGVIRDTEVWRRVLRSVATAAEDLGLEIDGVMPSPLLGPSGNVEFFLHAHRRTGAETEGSAQVRSDLDQAVEEAQELAARHG